MAEPDPDVKISDWDKEKASDDLMPDKAKEQLELPEEPVKEEVDTATD